MKRYYVLLYVLRSGRYQVEIRDQQTGAVETIDYENEGIALKMFEHFEKCYANDIII